MRTTSSATQITVSPKYLWFLMMSYTIVILLANWFDSRFVQIFWLTTDAGTIIFPLTFLLSDMITEVYGYKHARRAIWCGFLFNGVFLLYSFIVTHMPSPPFLTNNAEFDKILSFNARIIIASAISYFISEPLNSYIMAKLKIKTQGKHMALRFVTSTVFAAALDSTVFSCIAFYGVMPNFDLIRFILDMWLIKVAIEIIGLGFSIKAVKKLKRAEQLDIYDKNTKFGLLSLNTEYVQSDNAFKT